MKLKGPAARAQFYTGAELEAQLRAGKKCELEALNLAPTAGSAPGGLAFHNVCHFVEEAILGRDWLQ